MKKADIVIVGAGLIGSSLAMHLSKNSKLKILCIDIDLKGTFSSSELNAGGVRATWFHPLNSVLSKASIDYFEKIKDQIGFRQKGYLWMYDETRWSKVKNAIQNNSECDDLKIEFLNPSEVNNKFSFIDQLDEFGGATFSPKDGLLNPNLLKLHYRSEAQKNSQNIEFINHIMLSEVKTVNENKIQLKCNQLKGQTISDEQIQNVLIQGEINESNEIEIETKILVNCSGAWAEKTSKLYGGFCKSYPVKRQVSLFECKGVDFTQFGMFVDTSGVYFHPEANYVLSGFAIENEKPGYDMNYQHSFFENEIWPRLFRRASCFENIREITGWAGLYENSPDHSAVIGRVLNKANIFEAHSFSGRGVMQSYSAGLGLSELIMLNQYKSIDLSAFSAERFEKNENLIVESLVI